jgi:predicted  nucleic acid-binding Zn-ribbon protein
MGLNDQLLSLYRVDSQVRGLRSRVDNAERYLSAQDRQLEILKGEWAEVQLRVKQREASIANLETERLGFAERIEKLREELNACTTSKQYSAVQNEMSTLKEKCDELDTEALEIMEEVENERKVLDEMDTRITDRNTLRDGAESELTQRSQDVGERLTELEQERETAAAVLPGKVLSVFDRIADVTDGETLAEIREVNRRHREYACGECSMELPFDAVVRLTDSTDELVQCTGCQRILFLEENLRLSLAK